MRDFVAEAAECEIHGGCTFGEVAAKLRRLVAIQQDMIKVMAEHLPADEPDRMNITATIDYGNGDVRVVKGRVPL